MENNIYMNLELTEDELFFLHECVSKRINFLESEDAQLTELNVLEKIYFKLS